MIQFHEFYGKPTIQQINSFLKGMSHLISVKDAAEYVRNHFNLKKVKLNSTATKVMSFEQFISEEKKSRWWIPDHTSLYVSICCKVSQETHENES